jgi:activating signal cointegrator complex subunit 3
MAMELPWAVDKQAFDSPHVKANLLLQAYFARATLPMSDYVTDTRSVLEQALRVLQAMVDIAADGGWLQTTLGVMHLAQMVTQARFIDSSTLADLPHVDGTTENVLRNRGVRDLRTLLATPADSLRRILGGRLHDKALQELIGVIRTLPLIQLQVEPPPRKLLPGEEASITVHLRAANVSSRRNAFAPKFPKAKMAGWWLVMGEEEELFALKRIHFDKGVTAAELHFAAPDQPGEYAYSVFLVSDSYIGLDQEAEVRIVVHEGEPE